ncbi:MAG: DUF4920 domain-containing protein [Pyrinomonadaceae bacterium]|nr:DUF4920 domain-containing protein [Pyrinomonadaceae bacterium]
MKRIIYITMLFAALSFSAFAQEDSPMKKKATDADKIAEFGDDGKIKRGAAIGKSKKVSLKKVFKNPGKYSGKMVRVQGFVVRSCKKEGCWAELGATPNASKTVRVKMKDHAFFIPLKSAGYKVLTEGVFSLKKLSEKEVKHLMEEDGAKFDKINPDGTVTEISFLASGIVLTRE